MGTGKVSPTLSLGRKRQTIDHDPPEFHSPVALAMRFEKATLAAALPHRGQMDKTTPSRNPPNRPNKIWTYVYLFVQCTLQTPMPREHP